MTKVKSLKVLIITNDIVGKFYLYDCNNNCLGRFKEIAQYLQIDENKFIKLNSLISIKRSETDAVIMKYNAILLKSN